MSKRDETAGVLSRLHAVMQTATRKLETSNADYGSSETDAALVDAVGDVEVILRALLARVERLERGGGDE